MMECIEIALAANRSYVVGLLVTACSLAEHCSKEYGLRLNILDAEIPETDKRFVESEVCALHPNTAFRWIPVNEQMFAGLQKWNGGYMVYTRLLLPDLLKDCDWVIYCDCDFLWLRDVAELWRERDDQFGVISTFDGGVLIRKEETPWFAKQGKAFNFDTYFCAGLTFFNLKMFRERGWQDNCIQLLQSHPPYNDQTVLNFVTEGYKKLLPKPIWQCFSRELTKQNLCDGVVIHYAGDIPWKIVKGTKVPVLLSDQVILWHRANAAYRGISTWKSLRMFFSPSWIVVHRGLTLLIRLPILNWMIHRMCDWVKHPGVWYNLETRFRRILVN